MRTILIGFLLILLGCENAGRTVNSSDIYVVDGDTIKIGDEKFRLIGFDTPETYFSQCDAEKALGDRATIRLRELITSVRTVKLAVAPGLDKYGRGLARLYANGKDVGTVLISEGLARSYHGGKRQSWCQS